MFGLSYAWRVLTLHIVDAIAVGHVLIKFGDPMARGSISKQIFLSLEGMQECLYKGDFRGRNS